MANYITTFWLCCGHMSNMAKLWPRFPLQCTWRRGRIWSRHSVLRRTSCVVLSRPGGCYPRPCVGRWRAFLFWLQHCFVILISGGPLNCVSVEFLSWRLNSPPYHLLDISPGSNRGRDRGDYPVLMLLVHYFRANQRIFIVPLDRRNLSFFFTVFCSSSPQGWTSWSLFLFVEEVHWAHNLMLETIISMTLSIKVI